MTGGDILAKLRLVIAETAQTRWTDTALYGFINDAQRQTAYEVDFPEATYQIPVIPGQGLYQMQDSIKLLRIYILTPGGSQQPLPLVDIGTLEGNILEIYDQSSGQILSNPPYTPQWIAEQPQQYPVPSPFLGNYPSPTSLPYQSVTLGNQRPVAFMRGGYLGIVPKPVSACTVIIDYIPAPYPLTSNASLCIYPDGFKDAIVYKAAEYCFMSDRSSQADDCAAKFAREVIKLRGWKEQTKGTMPKRMTPITRAHVF